MSDSDRKARRRAARAALRDYMAGSQEGPLVLPRDGVCAFSPTLISKIRLAIRYRVIWLACLTILPHFLKRWLLRRTGVKVGRRVYLAPGVLLDFIFPSLIEIGDDCMLGEGSRIWAHEINAKSVKVGRVKLGRDTVIGGRAMVRCGVTIGNGVTVGACSFVSKDVPDGATVVGVPARPLGSVREEP